jgi:hypothetical protein
VPCRAKADVRVCEDAFNSFVADVAERLASQPSLDARVTGPPVSVHEHAGNCTPLKLILRLGRARSSTWRTSSGAS